MRIPLTFFALVASCVTLLGHATAFPGKGFGTAERYPRRTIAGVSVVDTPLVRAAQQFARDHGDDDVYNHVMRCWLFGTLMLKHNNTLQSIVGPGVHAVAILLHDLGFERTPNSTIVTLDHRFEVDGAIAARKFIRDHQNGRHWEERRVQLVWDAIALHGEHRFAWFKEPEVEAVSKSVSVDFSGPTFGISEPEYAAVLDVFPPAADFKASVVETMSWLCRTKPEMTYETFMQGYGDRFVPGYSAVGHRTVDRIIGL
ncbi:hypothetical protein B0I37DRAFT_164466 [Chaetomium sp. MPI-CAGE-AT-0009]|nr:hypothetical protein B0I37DRAFT_164466 [Chaetomium sp. MPI-CAGE-AT-0009]